MVQQILCVMNDENLMPFFKNGHVLGISGKTRPCRVKFAFIMLNYSTNGSYIHILL